MALLLENIASSWKFEKLRLMFQQKPYFKIKFGGTKDVFRLFYIGHVKRIGRSLIFTFLSVNITLSSNMISLKDFVITPANGETFKSSRIRTINCRLFLANTFHVKEHTHYSRRVGHEVPVVVAVLCVCMGG